MIPALANEQHAPREPRSLPEQAPWQFRTRSLLWLTFTAAMTLAYGRLFGQQAAETLAVTPILAAVIGAGLGSFTRRLAPAIYWAIIGGMAGAICVVAIPVENVVRVFWPLVGAVSGGYAGAVRPPITGRRVLEVAAAALLVSLLFLRYPARSGELYVDLLFAPAIAAALAIVVRLVDWLHHAHRASRDAWAAGLLFAVIAANLWTAYAAGRL
jgi:hypothetical protein